MKTIKINLAFILTISLVNLSLIGLSQHRNNPQRAKVLRKISELKNATGWIKNPSNRWDSIPNRIPAYLSEDSKSLINHDQYKLGIDNFKTFQLHEFKFGNDTMLLFLKEFTDGYYEYKSISEGWLDYSKTHIYVIKKKEFERLKTVKDSTQNIISLKSEGYYEYRFKSIEESLKSFENDFNLQATFKPNLVFNFSPFKSIGITQFLIYGETEYSVISRPNINSIKYGKDPFKDKMLHTKAYFECNYLSFNTLIQIN